MSRVLNILYCCFVPFYQRARRLASLARPMTSWARRMMCLARWGSSYAIIVSAMALWPQLEYLGTTRASCSMTPSSCTFILVRPVVDPPKR